MNTIAPKGKIAAETEIDSTSNFLCTSSRGSNDKPTLSTSLSVAVFIGKLIGFIPIEPQANPRRRRWLQPLSYVYVIVMGMAMTGSTVYLMAVDVLPIFKQLSISEGIIVSALNLVLSCSEVLKRAFFLSRLSLVHPTLGRILVLEAQVRNRNPGHCPMVTTRSSLVTVYGVWIFWVLNVALALFQVAMSIISFDSHSLLKNILVEGVIIKIWIASNVFSTVFIIGLGHKLLECYRGLAEEFIQNLERKQSNRTRPPKSDRDDNGCEDDVPGLIQTFQEAQACFAAYNRLVGFIALVSVIESCILSFVCTYAALDDPFRVGNLLVMLGEGLTSAVMYTLRAFLLAHLGETISDEMNGTKEQIRAQLLLIQTSNMNKIIGPGIPAFSFPEKVLADHILAWKWKFTACGLFDVNYKLFSFMLGSIMTYIMFMFQLRIAEETTGLNANRGGGF